MASFLDEIGAAVKQTACAVIATNDAINGYLESISFPGAESYQDTTRALRRQLCNNDDDTVPVPNNPQTGGLCPTQYETVNTSYNNGAGTTANFNGYRVYGPVSTYVLSENGFKYLRIDGFNSSGSEVTRTVTSIPEDQNQGLAWLSVNFVRVDGLADDCGSPPGEDIPPYVPSPVTVNIEYENNENITVNEDIDVTIFAPQVNLIGGIFAPVTISGNTFQLVGTVNLSPKFELQVSPEINIGGRGGGTDEQPPKPDKESPEPTENPDERRVIVGAVVTATSVSDRQDFLPQGENPDIAIPNLGHIAFYIATDGTRSWTADIPVKNVRSYIPCPVTSGAVAVSATGRSGVALYVEPIWAYPGQQM